MCRWLRGPLPAGVTGAEPVQVMRGPGPRAGFLYQRPTMGDLGSLCEENFVLLARLAPHLKDLRVGAVSRCRGAVDLYLGIEEQSPYTSRIRLTHLFPEAEPEAPAGGRLSGPRTDPDARLRVYHDARQVEVLDLRQTVLPLCTDYQRPALQTKWRVNLFLRKWLSFCLHQGHRFGPDRSAAPVPRDGDLIDSLT